MRQYLGLLVGLAVGIAGAILFRQSLPPAAGSPAEKIEEAQLEIRRMKRHISRLESGGHQKDPRRAFSEAARAIGEDVKAGRDVNVDDIFNAAKPWMRDFAPIFDRIRIRDQKKRFDTLAGELVRGYGLNPHQEKKLLKWFERKAEENSSRFDEVVLRDNSRFEDLIRATGDLSENVEGLDGFMEGMLEGETRKRFTEDRLMERAEQVQNEANRKFHRLESIVDLDEQQADEVFGLMARGARGFDSSMEIDDVAAGATSLNRQDRDQALMEVLRPEQIELYQAHRRRELEEAQRELNEIGLTLPPDWDLWDEDDF